MKLKLLGSKITKINAERNPDFSGKLNVNTNIKISSIEKYKPESTNIDSLKITSLFIIDYGNLGKIEIEGQLYISSDEDTIEEVIKNFDNKKFDTPEQITIMNLIMQRFSIKAFELEEELSLPIHIKLPSLQVKKD